MTTITRRTIPARPGNYTKGRTNAILYIVWHSGETSEGDTAAEGMAYWFQNPAAGGSAHKATDPDSIVTCIADGDTAYGAPGVNATGLHLELAGRAAQTSGEWADPASTAILANGAQVAAEWSLEHNIPARFLTDAELRAGNVRGMITHAQATRVKGGTHTDPGKFFPQALAERLTQAAVAKLTGAKAPAKPAPSAGLVVVRHDPAGLKVDGKLGAQTIAALQRACGLKGADVDGVMGEDTKRALQRHLKVTVDGAIGDKTIRALQRKTGASVDGVMGTKTIAALQRALNAGTF